MTPALSRNLNAIGALGIAIVLAMAFYFQFAFYDLPCPLCLLQRVAFVAVAFGLCLNLLWGTRARNYALMIVAALFGGLASGRQILLHIVPGTGAYGEPIFGLHYYTWAFILFGFVVLGAAVMLLLEGPDSASDSPVPAQRFGGNGFAKAAFFALVLLAAGNAVSTFLQCGLGVCADSPTHYDLLGP